MVEVAYQTRVVKLAVWMVEHLNRKIVIGRVPLPLMNTCPFCHGHSALQGDTKLHNL